MMTDDTTKPGVVYTSPLRYPGGKRKLANFIKLVFRHNSLLDGEYAEPYAGGASVALTLLYDEYVRKIYINDIDSAVYSFWYSALNSTDELCRLVNDTEVTIDEWQRQKRVQADSCSSPLQLGFSTFFLNRTNRSGIIRGGAIGGLGQSGTWLLDARYNKDSLIKRIQRVARYRDRIRLSNLDAMDFITTIADQLSARSIIYLDPPYYVKGQSELYRNSYDPDDHKVVSTTVATLAQNWIVSYDDVEEIRCLYSEFRHTSYGLSYSAQERYRGAEIMFFSPDLLIPAIDDPSRVRSRDLLNSCTSML